jgi:hypothetical protein
MTEFNTLQIDGRGRIRVFAWGLIPFAQADNNTLVAAFRQGRINWTLWRKSIARVIYEQALLMLGPEICTAVINRAEDRLQCATMYRFVRKFVHIDYYGYLYYQSIQDNSVRRFPNFGPISRIVNDLIMKMYAVRLPDSFNLSAFCALCEVIAR